MKTFNITTFDLDFEDFKILKEKVNIVIRGQEDININCKFEIAPNTAFSLHFLSLSDLLIEYQKESKQAVNINIFYNKSDLDMIEWVEEYLGANNSLINYIIT